MRYTSNFLSLKTVRVLLVLVNCFSCWKALCMKSYSVIYRSLYNTGDQRLVLFLLVRPWSNNSLFITFFPTLDYISHSYLKEFVFNSWHLWFCPLLVSFGIICFALMWLQVGQIFQKFECRDQSRGGIIRNVVQWSIPTLLEVWKYTLLPIYKPFLYFGITKPRI